MSTHRRGTRLVCRGFTGQFTNYLDDKTYVRLLVSVNGEAGYAVVPAETVEALPEEVQDE